MYLYKKKKQQDNQLYNVSLDILNMSFDCYYISLKRKIKKCFRYCVSRKLNYNTEKSRRKLLIHYCDCSLRKLTYV